MRMGHAEGGAFLKKIFSIFDKGIEWVEILTSVISLIIITILVFLQVVLRYVFSTSIPWTEEVVITLIVYMVLFGAARAVRTKDHTEVDGVAKSLPKTSGILLRFCTNLITVAALVITAYASFFLAGRIKTVTPVLRYKLNVNYYGIAVGAVLMVYEYLKLLKSRILGR